MLRTRKLLRLFFMSLVILLLISGGSFADTSVLFIGNSYTYYNSMPQMFKAMAEHQHPEQSIEVEFVGGGGATLKKHWEVGQALAEIQTGDWDYVVLQEQSSLGTNKLSDPRKWKQFFHYSRLFDEEIKKSGATTVFFMTWARRDSREQQKHLTTAYETIAGQLGSRVAPVGLAWDRIRDQEGINLYNKDGSHPSPMGSCLAALTLWGTIFNTAPQHMNGKLVGYEILRGGVLAEEKSILADFPAAVIEVLEDAVAGVLEPPAPAVTGTGS